MPSSNSWWGRRSAWLLICACVAVFIIMVLYGVHKRAGISTLLGTAGSAEGDGGTRIETLKTANQELKTQVRNLEEALRLASQERDSLKEDKKQLLYMVEKLQQQSVTSAASGQGGGVSGKVVRSWLVRISELKHTGVREEAQARNEYIKEVNEVVRGLKEDFSEDTFIMGIGYAKTSSRVKNDINAAQTKLEDIIQYLRAYDYGAD